MSFRVLRGRSQKHEGLFTLAEPAEEPVIVDIVAVHGLGGDAFSTWEANGKSWLRDFLPHQLPGCRVMTYGYDAPVGIGKRSDSLSNVAQMLLVYLQLERWSTPTRPIIFICHSLGGLVVKKAVLLASESRSRYLDLLDSINGVVFMGTPHRGTDSGLWRKFLSQTLELAGVNSELNDMNLSFSRAMSDEFAERGRRMRFISIYETRGLPSIPVVHEASAVLGLPNETTIRLPVNHRDLSRFDSEDSLEYRTVSAAIRNLYQGAVENMNSSARMAPRSSIVETTDIRSLAYVHQADELPQFEKVLASEQWLQQLDRLHRALALDSRGGEARTKIAIIDAAFEIERYDGKDPGARDTFVRGPQQHVGYHAVLQARLISRVAPGVECYIAQVSRDDSDTSGTRFEEDVAQAISHAVSNWRVDILSLSFALSYESAVIRDALLRVSMRGALLFAAASQSKLSGLRSFPGNQQDVICIYATDAWGRTVSPGMLTANRGPNFAVPGEQIPVRSDRPGEEQRVSGSSFSTAIAAGIAANILEIARRAMDHRHLLSKHEIDHLHRAEGMTSVLKAMSQDSDGTLLLQPWKLLTSDPSPRGAAEAVRSALGAALSMPVDEADMSELASDAGSVTSAYSGTTLGGYTLTSSEESIARLLFDEPVLNPLYRPGLTRLGYLAFQGHFKRILHRHAGRLGEDAKTNLEKKYASLLKLRSRAITQAVVNLVSLTDTEKVAAMERLKDEEPFATDVMRKYIADLWGVPQSQGQPAALAEADPNLEEDASEDDVAAEEMYQDMGHNDEELRKFMRSPKPFQQLQEDLCVLAFPDTKERIRTVLDTSQVFSDDSSDVTITCQASWQVLSFCRAELGTLQNVSEIITFTGNQRHAQAAPCNEYMRQTWPETWEMTMRAFSSAVNRHTCKEEQLSPPRLLKMKLVSANEWLKREESAEITIAGSRWYIGQALEQLAWLAATFRKHEGSSMIASYANLTLARRPSPERLLPLFELSIFAPRPVTFKERRPGSCWVRLLPASVLACGFPYALRTRGVGLEVPFHLMVHLTGAQFPVKYGEGIVFRGRQAAGVRDKGGIDRSGTARGTVTPMLVPTLSMKDSIQWHFLEASSEPSLVTYNEDREFLEAMGDSIPLDPLKNIVDIDSHVSTDSSPADDVGDSKFWFQTTDLDLLTNSRAFLGAWKVAKVHIGTRAFERHIQPSSRHANARRLDQLLDLRSYFNKISEPLELRISEKIAVTRHCQLLDDPQLFRLSAMHPILLYDSEAHRAWLVSELSVALQLAHNHLNDTMQIAPRLRRRLRYAEARDDGGNAADDAIGRCRKEKLWEQRTFGTIVKNFLLMIETAKGCRVKGPSDRIPISEFVDLQNFLSTAQSTRQDEADKHALSPSWWSIARNPSIATVFGSHFGQVVTPDTSRIRVCSFWKAIPEGKGLLTASMPCSSAFLKRMIECDALPTDSDVVQGSARPRDQVTGARGECIEVKASDCKGDAKCNLMQKLAIIKQGRYTLPIKGAIIFGDNHLDKLPIRCTRMDFTAENRYRVIIWPFFLINLAWLLALAAAG